MTRNTMLLATAATFMLSTTAMAQTTSNNTAADTNQPQNQAAMHGADLQQQVRGNLRQAGFTDIKVVPDSFLVQAKDKSGNPITMMINPGSLTEVVDIGSAQGGAAPSDGGFVTVAPGERMESKVVGLEVRNDANQDIGTIKDIAYRGNSIQAYVLSVGGFLGMGDRYVAVAPSAVQISYDHNAKTWHATMDTTAAKLKAAPAYQYPNQA